MLQVEVKLGNSKVDEKTSSSPQELISDAVKCLGPFIEFTVTDPVETAEVEDPSEVNPFMMMMAAQQDRRSLPKLHDIKKPNRKLSLKNDILQWLEQNELGWDCRCCSRTRK